MIIFHQLADPQTLAPQARRRRALVLLAATLVFPGSAQLVAGSPRIGRIAIHVWGGCWAAICVTGLLWWQDQNAAIRVALGARLFMWLPFLLILLAAGWGFLFVDAWRLGRPPMLTMQARRAVALAAAGCIVLTVLPLGWTAHQASAARTLLSQVFTGTEAALAAAGRYNILLLGADSGDSRVGLRPDSITLASVDEKTGRSVLFSFPRNLENIPFPPDSPMHRAWPAGFDCGDDCLLNAVYTFAEEHPEIYGQDVAESGVRATIDAVRGISGLDIQYAALVDLQGFQDFIDAAGGVKIDVRQELPIGQGDKTLKTGLRTLNGYEALWFARSRKADNDYARMARQRCVLTAMLDQLDPVTVITRFDGIATASAGILRTTIPPAELGRFADLAMMARTQAMTSVSFVPPLITPGRPDYNLIRQRINKAIAGSTATKTTPASARAPKASPSSSGRRSMTDQQKSAVCTAV
ncbi:MAG: LCP family protein [Actinomycetota bacterium]